MPRAGLADGDACALPQRAARRRIDLARRQAEAKGGMERAEEERKAVSAVVQALRHDRGLRAPVTISVQREPFEAKGARTEAFAPGTRFAKERLWHVQLEPAGALRGPHPRRRPLSGPRPDEAGHERRPRCGGLRAS